MKNIKILFSTVLLTLALYSCNKEKQHNGEEQINVISSQTEVDSLKTQEHNHWSYEGKAGPDYWADLGNNECGGSKQSPINIIAVDAVKDSVAPLNESDLHYSPETKIYSVVNNGHSIQYNLKTGDYLEYNGGKYNLIQFHAHSPSEHLLNGVRFPLELHMVHLTKDKRILVLAFLVEEGEKNIYFNGVEEILPLKKGEEKAMDTNADFLEHIDKDFKYYHYIGSLTTPPCTEGVNWFVMQKPIIMSQEQVKLFKESMPENNYRPVQPLNGRVVTYN